jgi:starch synthase (maltosyl-transferring)
MPPRPVVEDVRPRVDDGRYDAKGVVGDAIEVRADAFVDGHDVLRVEVRHRPAGTRSWRTTAMAPVGNDGWHAYVTPAETGHYEFSVQARVDHFATWLRDLRARVGAGQDVAVELLVGLALVRAAAERAKGTDAKRLGELADLLPGAGAVDLDALDDEQLIELVARNTTGPTTGSPTYRVRIEHERARFSTWYELFPRSASPVKGGHGTFTDVIGRLDDLVELGIDVLYLPPIHPIGTTARKGRNGAPTAKRGDVGSPWAIGAPEGGHTGIHPQLGSLDDFRALVAAARERGIDVALDIAFQCSPDHPWVSEHPEWFNHRPDGTIRYAENPPKRYEDVYPLDFETEQWRDLWDALRE